MISCNSLWGKWKIVWKACCNAVLVVVILDRMHFCTGGGMVGEDAWQRHCIECGFMQCNYNALPPTSTVQLFSLFNRFKFFLSRVFLCFLYLLAFKYHSVFPVICVGQLKDKSLKVGIVGIIIRWCVCAGSTTPTSRDPSKSQSLPQRESIRTQVIRIHIEAARQPTNTENHPIQSNILRTTNYTKKWSLKRSSHKSFLIAAVTVFSAAAAGWRLFETSQDPPF